MITITIQRQEENQKCTLGSFKAVSSQIEGIVTGYTLELPWKDNQERISCITAGEYDAYIRDHKTSKWDYDVIQLKKVPGRNAIQIHIGNYPHQTLGCILIGSSVAQNNKAVWKSGAKYKELMKFIQKDIEVSGEEDIVVIVKDVTGKE